MPIFAGKRGKLLPMENEKQGYLRKKGIASRNALTLEYRKKASEIIIQKIISLSEYAKAKTIMSYMAVGSEVDLWGLWDIAKKDEKILCFPLCEDPKEQPGIMSAIAPDDEDSFVSGAFGIREPDISRGRILSPSEIDLVICPCSTFDEKNNRIGMGGGYYDRYLPKCTRAVVIAVGFSCQKSEILIPRNTHDIKMDLIVTED